MDRVRVLVLRDGDAWVAQCIEYDIGAQASTVDELTERLSLTLDAEMQHTLEQGGSPFAGIPPAPSHFGDIWEKTAGEFRPGRDLRQHSSDGSSLVEYEFALVERRAGGAQVVGGHQV